jgi:hypothetical protein
VTEREGRVFERQRRHAVLAAEQFAAHTQRVLGNHVRRRQEQSRAGGAQEGGQRGRVHLHREAGGAQVVGAPVLDHERLHPMAAARQLLQHRQQRHVEVGVVDQGQDMSGHRHGGGLSQWPHGRF